MNTVTPETLPQLIWQNHKVITTELLAQCYETDPVRIRQSYTRNPTRFIEGIHFFKIEGDELENLRVSFRYSQNSDDGLQVDNIDSQISSKTRTLMLWTEKGAVRHAKILDTDKAWEVQERLEEAYFHPERRTDSIAQQAHSTAYLEELVNTQRQLITAEQYSHEAFKEKANAYNAHLLKQNASLNNILSHAKESQARFAQQLSRAERAQRPITEKEEKEILVLHEQGWAVRNLTVWFYRSPAIVKRAIRNQGGAL